MITLTSGKFIFKSKWITDPILGRIETDQKERLSIKIKYTLNGNPKYNRTYQSTIDLLIFDPYDYDYLENIMCGLENDLDTFIRGITIPEDYIIFKQNNSLRLSPKISKAMRRILTDNEKVLCDENYYYANRYNSKFKSYNTIDLNDYVSILKEKLTNPYILAEEFKTHVTTI